MSERTEAGMPDTPIQPYDSDHTALVHVLWAAQREGLTLEKADDLAERIMTSRWMKAVRLHASQPPPPPPESPEERHHRELHDGTLNEMPPEHE